jgi:hypothetical protein
LLTFRVNLPSVEARGRWKERFIADRQSEETDDDGKITKRAAKPAEINRELAALRRSFNLAVQAGRLITCPHFPMLRERNTRRGFLDRDQIGPRHGVSPAIRHLLGGT